jgi:LPS-assembly lipoprotein
MRPRTAWLILPLALLLGGCGFHLQGVAALPADLHKVYVAATDELSPFAVELDRVLKDAGAEIVVSPAEAETTIRVAQDRTGRRILSVSSRNTPQEYQVFYSLKYSIERGDKQAVPEQEIELTRSYSFSESSVLAKDREEEILRQAMARDLANLVVRRLESL